MAQTHDAPGFAAGSFRNGTVRGVDGFFRVAQDHAGRWWLLGPDGTPFFLRAVHGIRAPHDHTDGALPPDTAARLRKWGFNAVGLNGDHALRS